MNAQTLPICRHKGLKPIQQIETGHQNKKTFFLERLSAWGLGLVHLVYRLRKPEVAKKLNRLHQMVQTMGTRSTAVPVEIKPQVRLRSPLLDEHSIQRGYVKTMKPVSHYGSWRRNTGLIKRLDRCSCAKPGLS